MQIETLLPEGWQLSPTLLPALLAFIAAPPASLRVSFLRHRERVTFSRPVLTDPPLRQSWIASQSLAAPQDVNPAEQKSLRKRRAVHLLGLFAVVFGAEYWLIAQEDQRLFSWFITGIFGILIQLSLMGFFADFFGAVKMAAYRAPSGMTLWRWAPGSVSHVRMAGVVLLSGAINAQSFIAPNEAITFGITSALVYRFLVAGHHKTLSIRGIMMVLIGWIAASFALSGLMIMMIVRLQAGDTPVSPTPVDAEEMLSPRAQDLTQLITSVLFAAGPGILIAACYRFDYHHHITACSLPLPTLEVAERRMCPSRRRACQDACSTKAPLAPGVIVPSHSPRGFSRPLYFTSLISWLAVQIATMAAFAYFPIPQELKEERSVIDLAALAATIPIMVVSVLAAAFATGRAKEMWTYREKWCVLPQVAAEGAIRLAEDDLEETVPAYEVVVKEDVAPAYQVDVKA
ncbi:hypothetical protein P7C70_g2466, partial [Phenoliferia sp. Uapishka_3]